MSGEKSIIPNIAAESDLEGTMKKTLPIGIDSFREIRDTDRYYVDKTLFIRDFMQSNHRANARCAAKPRERRGIHFRVKRLGFGRSPI